MYKLTQRSDKKLFRDFNSASHAFHKDNLDSQIKLSAKGKINPDLSDFKPKRKIKVFYEDALQVSLCQNL